MYEPKILRSSWLRAGAFAALMWTAASAPAAVRVEGRVVDTNGQPVAQAQVIFQREAGAPGARVVTVFTDMQGKFRFGDEFPEASASATQVSARALGYRQVQAISPAPDSSRDTGTLHVTLLVARTPNQIDVAPASAWLNRITDRAQKSRFVMDCIDCHQVPSSEVRHYAASIVDAHPVDPALARSESWKSIVKYMNYLTAWEFSRGRRSDGEKVNTDTVYGVDNGDEVASLLTRVFDDRLDSISGYQWGAPLVATPATAIYEYEVPHPNAIREALMMGDPRQLWVADVAANRMISIDVASGAQQDHEVPSGVLMSPHSLHPGADGSLWVTPLFNSVVAHRDPRTGKWRTWTLKTPDGKNPGIHDLSFGHAHELLTDKKGRIWFSDIGNNSVGYFDPADGQSRVWPAPPSPGREGATALYGLAMTKDRNQVWYSQLANGTFGGFDIDKQQYIGPFQLPDRNAGPRRIAIDDNDVLYMALYGSGQIAVFDTKSRQMVGLHDLPDTGSAPYATTWDPVRRVVWVATSNGDVIYRFDPGTKQVGILPMPREQAFLRMIDVDKRTGVLVTSYANIVDIVQGPRMALIVDPGDGAYPEKFTPGFAGPAQPILAASANRPTAPPPGADGARLVENARCYACHDQAKVSLGPPFAAIAARHGSNREVMTDVLAHKIVHGGGGNWGMVPMVPNEWVTLEEARAMSAWILGSGDR
jgi:streptogramin lyase/cytochrome c551/c552